MTNFEQSGKISASASASVYDVVDRPFNPALSESLSLGLQSQMPVWRQLTPAANTFTNPYLPYLPGLLISPATEKPVEKAQPDKQHQQQAQQHDWFHDACDFVSGSVDIAAQVVVGAAETAVDAVVNHTADTALMLAEGVVVGGLLVAAAPIALAAGAGAATVATVAALADVGLVGLTTAGVIGAGNETIKAASASALSADVLLHKSQYSNAEIAAAREDMQSKTGLAALEVVGAAMMTKATFGSAVRLTKFSGDFISGNLKPLKIVDGALEVKPLTTTAGDALLEAKPVSAAAAAKFDARVDAFLAAREEAVPLEPMVKSLAAEGGSDSGMKILPGFYQYLGKAEFPNLEAVLDQTKVRSVLQDHPLELQEYESYRVEQLQKIETQARVNAELDIRRQGLQKIINENAAELFPESKMHTIRVEQQPANIQSGARYGGGAIQVADSNLLKPGYGAQVFGKSRFVEVLVHEMKHGEQDALLLRSMIDRVTGGDTSGRALTAAEMQSVLTENNTRLGRLATEDMVNEVNQMRGGKVLTAAQSQRAAALEDSWLDFLKHNKRFEGNSKSLSTINQFVNYLDSYPTRIFWNSDFDTIFTRETLTPELKALKTEWDSNTSHYLNNREFAERAKPAIGKALDRELDIASQLYDADFSQYENLLHEFEAFTAQKQAAAIYPSAS